MFLFLSFIFFLLQIGEQEGGMGSSVGVQIMYTHVWNAKMIPAKMVPETGGGVGVGWRRAVDGVNSSMIYLIHCKKVYKCYNVPPLGTTIKKEHVN
jgi:hypothetical protein